jgi:hypothetical protein
MDEIFVEIDPKIAKQAAEILGTTTLQDTIHAALLEVIHQRRRSLAGLFAEEGRFDFAAAEHAWGGEE